MKVRNGFVSNSSSSSFVIHKSAFKNDSEFEEFYDKLVEVDRNVDEEYEFPSYRWGDSEGKYEKYGNFIIIETFHAPKEVKDLIREYKITTASKDVYVIEY